METANLLLLLQNKRRKTEVALVKTHIELFGYRSAIVTPTPTSIYVDPNKKNKYCEYNFECDDSVPIIINLGSQKIIHVHLDRK